MSRGFDCDRQAKYDFTASTAQYWSNTTDPSLLGFYEMTSAGTLVPFGSEEADDKSHMDLYIHYSAMTNGDLYDVLKYAVELKERTYNSNTGFLISKGSFINPKKIESIRQETGVTHLWAELYPDDVIRIWNLSKIDLDSIRFVPSRIKRYDIYNGPKIPQKRGLLPVDKAITIRRVRGNDKQGDS